MIIPGGQHTCPICHQELPHAEMAVNSHLRKHVREGKLATEQELELRRRILGRRDGSR